MSTIGSNIAALKSLHNLRLNEDGFAKATERLSSGKRLNNAGDDAAGAAIVNRMSSQIAGMNVAIRNAGDAISMSQVAEGALHEVSEILQRMRELAVQAANGSYSGADRVSLNQEIVSLKKREQRPRLAPKIDPKSFIFRFFGLRSCSRLSEKVIPGRIVFLAIFRITKFPVFGKFWFQNGVPKTLGVDTFSSLFELQTFCLRPPPFLSILAAKISKKC